MIPAQFDYHSPSDVGEAISLLTQYGEDAKLLAGGHSLLPMMKLRLAQPGHLIDLGGIDELKGIRKDGDTLVIGAMTRENELLNSELLHKHCPLIPAAVAQIADPQVRNRGTIGGDIAHGDPGNDHPALMMALNAVFVLRGPKGERQVPADGFFLGMLDTQLAADEVMTQIRVPVFKAHTGYSYQKLKRKTGDWATAGSAAVLVMSGATCQSASLALTNVAETAVRARDAEALLAGQKVDEALIERAAGKVADVCNPVEDLRGDAEYKTHMAVEMTRRAIREAVARAKGS